MGAEHRDGNLALKGQDGGAGMLQKYHGGAGVLQDHRCGGGGLQKHHCCVMMGLVEIETNDYLVRLCGGGAG